jgi:hypothetical protein
MIGADEEKPVKSRLLAALDGIETGFGRLFGLSVGMFSR